LEIDLQVMDQKTTGGGLRWFFALFVCAALDRLGLDAGGAAELGEKKQDADAFGEVAGDRHGVSQDDKPLFFHEDPPFRTPVFARLYVGGTAGRTFCIGRGSICTHGFLERIG
jgi:hypothetical protein